MVPGFLYGTEAKRRRNKSEPDCVKCDRSGGMFSLFAFFCAVVLYFAPAIIAHHRQHESSGKIFLVNLLLGWSILGWIACLAWACSGRTRQRVIILPPERYR